MLGKVHVKEEVRLYNIPRSKSVCMTLFGVATATISRLYMYVYFVLKACARESILQRSRQVIHVRIPCSKSVCTTLFGVATTKTSRLDMNVLLVLKACARESTLQRAVRLYM